MERSQGMWEKEKIKEREIPNFYEHNPHGYQLNFNPLFAWKICKDAFI